MRMKLLVAALFFTGTAQVALAQDSDRVKYLEQKVQKLEERIARTERYSAANQQTHAAEKMQRVARLHMEAERKNFNQADIRAAEKLYARASRLLWSDSSKMLIDSIVSKYPHLNRAGCAQLYRAQQETGPEKEQLLKDCITRFSTCYYGDGCQVGPMAMYMLAKYYMWNEREQDARKLYRKLRMKYYESVGHDGILLIDRI